MLNTKSPLRLGPLFLVGFAFVALLSTSACKKPYLGSVGNEFFGVTRDTVQFDTLFTTVQSPSERELIYNRTGSTITLDEVYIEGGEGSVFRLILDGVRAQRHTGLEVATQDSVYCFLSLKADVPVNTFFEDFLVIKAKGKTLRIPLRAQVLDAYFYRNVRLTCNFIMPTDKPIIIDGIAQVDTGCVLTIPAGAKIYFTSKRDQNFNVISSLTVYGTLLVQGSPGNPVLFSSFRLSPDFSEIAGQWNGIILYRASQNNVIESALIKNGTIGLRVDSIAEGIQPKVRLNKVEIRNMSNYGLLGLGASPSIFGSPNAIEATNCLFHNAGQSPVGLFFGGNYLFVNSTIANYGYDFSRKQPALSINNYRTEPTVAYQLDANFQNCIIWGSEENEVGIDLNTGLPTPPSARFVNCLIRYDTPGEIKGSNNYFDKDPLFKDSRKNDYAIVGDSSLVSGAVDRGLSNALTPFDDFGSRNRLQPPDIGAWEYLP
jgi:hypothetical protein